MRATLGFREEYSFILMAWLDATLWRINWRWQRVLLEAEPDLFGSMMGPS
jgi:hypothetical protein